MATTMRGLAICQGCRRSVLRSLISSLGGSSATIETSSLLPPLLPQRRAFLSSSARSFSDAPERVQHAHLPLNDIDDAIYEKGPSEGEGIIAHDGAEQSTPETSTHVPWYLQNSSQPEPTNREEHPMAARQRIPELPESPPVLLDPLLKHVSIELGIDDLTLLDLRALDPPPALGANLIMLIGTARSEKHLHVSADRLCRWLRTEYHLSPYADGLLGRNELKLKLRRKAKRSRLMSAVGAKSTSDTDVDEGIRTGWVCVNIGRVQGGELPEDAEKLQRAEGVVGFGARVGGCCIVVQMLTEEKRGAMDLEKLWTGIMSRARRDKDKADVEDGNADSAMPLVTDTATHNLSTAEKQDVAGSVQYAP